MGGRHQHVYSLHSWQVKNTWIIEKRLFKHIRPSTQILRAIKIAYSPGGPENVILHP